MWRQQLKQRLDVKEEEKSMEFIRAKDQEHEKHDGNIRIDAVYSLNDPLHLSVVPADAQLLIKEEAPEEQKPDVDQQDREHLHIKEEEEELWISLGEEQLNVKEETDDTRCLVTAVPLKHVDDEDKPLFLQLHQHQAEAKALPTSSSADNPESTTVGESCGGAETTGNTDLSTHEEDSDSSETEDSEDDEEGNVVNNPDSQLKNFADSGSQTEDTVRDREPSRHRGPESGVKKNQNVKKLVWCDLCGQRFTLKGHLVAHMRIHTGERPFCCELCDRRFTNKSNLNTHMRIHTGQKPFSCELCGRKFSKKSSLNNHTRIHTGQKPFCCEVCGRKFTLKVHLTTHMRIHTGQKPFCCELCGRRFTKKCNLNKHTIVHTGLKPFSCGMCYHKFTTKSDLKRHMRVHIENEAIISNDPLVRKHTEEKHNFVFIRTPNEVRLLCFKQIGKPQEPNVSNSGPLSQ